jgi:hypothetical protein
MRTKPTPSPLYDREALMEYFRCHMRAAVDAMIEEQNTKTTKGTTENKRNGAQRREVRTQ